MVRTCSTTWPIVSFGSFHGNMDAVSDTERSRRQTVGKELRASEAYRRAAEPERDEPLAPGKAIAAEHARAAVRIDWVIGEGEEPPVETDDCYSAAATG